MTNFLAILCDSYLSLISKQGPNLCTGAAFFHRFPRSIGHFSAWEIAGKLIVSTVRVSDT